jgi:hypothetical protein
MRSLKSLLVWPLLIKTLLKTLARQLYIKLTKFTRRTTGSKAFGTKLAKTYYFVKDMSRYNLEVIKRSRHCLQRLRAEKVDELSVFGEADVIEVLYHLTFEIPMKIRVVYKNYPIERTSRLRLAPLAMAATGSEKVVVASLVNCEAIVDYLRDVGVENERIILL